MHLSLEDGPEDEKHFVLFTFDLEMGWSQNTHNCTTVFTENEQKDAGRQTMLTTFRNQVIRTPNITGMLYKWLLD